jgi:hypothetical protein
MRCPLSVKALVIFFAPSCEPSSELDGPIVLSRWEERFRCTVPARGQGVFCCTVPAERTKEMNSNYFKIYHIGL